MRKLKDMPVYPNTSYTLIIKHNVTVVHIVVVLYGRKFLIIIQVLISPNVQLLGLKLF